ncbi:DUF410-domain-containing protein [Auricularia subglabra TFB-10046 SS5]|uniref:DUF410-domain-containing protein n=1 Tax=Auricularia subglabra (strain TFB-10046 / SS5) TaxID=717982 RepID=J0DAJ0_AURST|nr:DUF410-domain-containing protein [Auricularia subglabra TFB-10046 SS5]
MPPAPSANKALSAILPQIAEGHAYEAHQKARTFASRYTKSGQHAVAIEVLFQSARELLKTGQQGSGTDLAVMMLDAYDAADVGVDDESRGRVTQLIALVGPGQTWRKTVVDKAVAWSAKYGECPAGDPDLHHYIGELLYKEGAFVQAEPHLLSAGKRDSARLLGQLLAEWSKAGSSSDLGLFAARGTLPYLELENILAARAFLRSFLATASLPGTTALPVGDSGDEIVLTSDNLLNFLQLAVPTLQRAPSPRAREAWTRLVGTYSTKGGAITHPEIRKAIQDLSATYFNIQPPRPAGNPFGDLLSGLFGGGGAPPGAGAGRGRPGARPAAVGLD